MDSILEEAAAIVAERQQLYDLVVADFYFMAQLADDQETQNHLWQEAWDRGNNHLIMLLVLIEMHLNDSA